MKALLSGVQQNSCFAWRALNQQIQRAQAKEFKAVERFLLHG